MTYIMIVLSLVLLVTGANWLVDGSAAIARRYHISEYIIGATIVGMGTSTPELVVSVISAIEGHSDIAIGNVVGSNTFNVFLILGVTALMMPITYTRDNITRDIPINIGTSVAVIMLCIFSKVWRGEYGLGRFDGLLMLALFALYLWGTLRSERQRQADGDEEGSTPTGCYRSTAVCILAIIGGLAGLIFGGDMFVDAASAIAREWGVSEAIIGLTIVAGGTSLPELVSSIIAVTKRKGQLALGNITFVDWGTMLLSAIALLIASATFTRRQLDRKDAACFLLIYAAYMVWLIVGVTDNVHISIKFTSINKYSPIL